MGHTESFRTNLVSFRNFRRPLFPKPVIAVMRRMEQWLIVIYLVHLIQLPHQKLWILKNFICSMTYHLVYFHGFLATVNRMLRQLKVENNSYCSLDPTTSSKTRTFFQYPEYSFLWYSTSVQVYWIILFLQMNLYDQFVCKLLGESM